MNRTLVTVIITLFAAAAFALVGAFVVIARGLYDVGVMTQHTQPVYTLLATTMKQAVQIRAADIETPPLSKPALIARGAACYRSHCVQCHGGAGVPPDPIGLGMQPLPGPLVDAARRWHPREIYWITRNGIRMSGMPAWSYRLSDEDLWAVVSFVSRMSEMSPTDYGVLMDTVQGQQCRVPYEGAAQPVATSLPPDELARSALRQYACVSCHTIPGVTGGQARVGPPLDGFSRRVLIAGRLPNNVDNLVRWLREPQEVKPGTAMPDLGVTELHAQQIAGYLSRRLH